MICGECAKFSECFYGSNELLDVESENISIEMVDEAMKILACENFTCSFTIEKGK